MVLEVVFEASGKLRIVPAPPATHAAIAIAAMHRGLHVLCQKPLAMNRSEAEEMCAVAEEEAVVAVMGHEFRWAPEVAVIQRALISGAIGQPRLAVVITHLGLHADPASPAKPWWFDVDQGGGNLGAHGSHLIDQLRVWFGEVDSVSARLDLVGPRPAGSADDSFSALLSMRSGVQVVVQHTVAARGPRSEIIRISSDRMAPYG